MAPKKSATNSTIYQLKITLKYIRPPIWRRVQVLSTTTLHQLHLIIQATMGWYNCHLHSFSIAGIEYGQPQPDDDKKVPDSKSVKLSQVVAGEKFKFFYTYDIGDDWEHEILVEKHLPAVLNVQYPVFITGKRACPPEDCGGPWGYAELLEMLNDPENPEYVEKIEWLGKIFAPDIFDKNEVQQRLVSYEDLDHF